MRTVALTLALALIATAPGLAPYQALAQVVERPVTGVGVETMPGLAPQGALDAQPGLQAAPSLPDAGAALPSGSLDAASPVEQAASADRSPSAARSFEGLPSAPIEKVIKPIRTRPFGPRSPASPTTAPIRPSATFPRSAGEGSKQVDSGYSEGTARFDGAASLPSAPVEEPESESLGSDLPRSLEPAQVQGRSLAAAPEPKASGSVGHAIVSTVLSGARVAAGGAAVVGAHVGLATALPGLFGFAALPSMWAVSSAVVLLPMALVSRYRLAKTSAYPLSKGPNWLMDGAIGATLGAAMTAFPQYFPFLDGVLPLAHAGAISAGPLLGMMAMAVTTTVSFYLPYVAAAIRGPSRAAPLDEKPVPTPKKIPNWHYQAKTYLFMGAMLALWGGLGWEVFGVKGALINLGIAGAISGLMYLLSDTLIKAAVGGKEADPARYAELYAMVKELATKDGFNIMPKVYLMPPGMGPNAMATGRDPDHAAVAVTPEAMALFSSRELRAVLGHEMSHVKNRDMRTSAILGSFATAIAFGAWSVLYAVTEGKAKIKNMLSSGMASGDRAVQDGQDPSKGQKPEVFDPLTGGIVLASVGGAARAFAALWGPIIATMLQMSGSRTREFAADYDGAILTDDPEGLAMAFEKLEGWRPGPGFKFDSRRSPLVLAVSPYMTVSPLEKLGINQNLRLPQFSWSSTFWLGLGVVFSLLSGHSAPAKFINIGFMVWQFFGAKPIFNIAWVGALGVAVATGWQSPLTFLAFAFLCERVAVWTVAALKKMLPRDGTPREDMDEFVFRRFVTHPPTSERIARMRKMAAAMGKNGKGPTPPAGPTFGAKPNGDGPQGPSLPAAPEQGSRRSGLDGRLLPAVQQLKGRLESRAGSNLAHLGWALNELLASGGAVRYGDPRSNGQRVLSSFDPATRSIELSETLRFADPGLQAALLAASLQQAYDHLEARRAGTREQALRRMEVLEAYLETTDPVDLARKLDLNNPAETGLYESLMTSRIVRLAGGASMERRIGHLPTVERLLDESKTALKLARQERNEHQDRLRLVEEALAAGRDVDGALARAEKALKEDISILDASIRMAEDQVAELKKEAKTGGLVATLTAAKLAMSAARIDLPSLPVVPEERPAFADAALGPALELVRGEEGPAAALAELEARGGRVLFGPTPAGQAAYFSPVSREVVVNDAYRRIPAPLIAALLVHELTHAEDAFAGRSLTRETEHRAFTAMARFLENIPPEDVQAQIEANNPSAVFAFQWMYSIRRQFLKGKTTLEALVANAYTQHFHSQFSGHQSAAGTLSEFRTRTLAPAKEQLARLREHEKLLKAAGAAGDVEREGQLRATERSIEVQEGLVTLYERMQAQYASEAHAE